mmetsp:Transcript_19035/g.44419  ORF Transcript_19035/g.44419 Transcript_19035/m.44419 type:complete len:321 (-) Transcript_19035:45-1007(-)
MLRPKVEMFSMAMGDSDEDSDKEPPLPDSISDLALTQPDDISHSQLWTQLYTDVEAIVEPVAHLEKKWTQQELTKRLVRYIFKGVTSPAMETMPWREACQHAIQRAMQPIIAACNEADWFFQIDLLPVLTNTVWTVLSVADAEVTFRQVQEESYNEYHRCVDELLLTKGIWRAVEDTFVGDKVQSKVFNALSKTYGDALQGAKCDIGPPEGKRPSGEDSKTREFALVRAFFKRWVEDSMNRVWSIENADRLFTPKNVCILFQRLLLPFGEEDGFSCVPAELTAIAGPPPPTWGFVGTAVNDLFRKWDRAFSGPAPKRSRR